MNNSSHITRAELAAHIQRIDAALDAIDGRLARIEARLDARPVQRWLTGRATRLIDNALPSVLVGLAVALAFLF